jgi:hypothetical protein
LSQQLALSAAALCFLASMVLVLVAARSNQFVQEELLGEFGDAVAQQLARRLSTELATGDRLGVVAELNRVVELAAVTRATARSIEGADFADAGERMDGALTFVANIDIDGNIAGEVLVAVDASRQAQARRTLVLALTGLAALLAIVVYSLTRALAQRLARRIDQITDQLATVAEADIASDNELRRLIDRVSNLPLELLKPSSAGEGDDEHYRDTAVLYVNLKSLPGYVDTVDAPRLQRYVSTVHRLVFAAAGFYGGELHVVRQFGLAIYFSGEHKIGSPVLRAASCGWLIQQAAPAVEDGLRLSLRQGLSIGISELGPGSGRDIYPGLYTQSTLDDLRLLAATEQDALLLSRDAARDVDLTTRMKVMAHGENSWRVDDVADGHRDLLERQLHILLGAVLAKVEAHEPAPGQASIPR